jgi:hypothetical protein
MSRSSDFLETIAHFAGSGRIVVLIWPIFHGGCRLDEAAVHGGFGNRKGGSGLRRPYGMYSAHNG